MKAAAAAAPGTPIEVWFADEARVGQQGTLTRVWAERGSRPVAPRDCRYASAYLFGAVCPARGIGAGLVLPTANARTMTLHLAGGVTSLFPTPVTRGRSHARRRGAEIVMACSGLAVEIPA